MRENDFLVYFKPAMLERVFRIYHNVLSPSPLSGNSGFKILLVLSEEKIALVKGKARIVRAYFLEEILRLKILIFNFFLTTILDKIFGTE